MTIQFLVRRKIVAQDGTMAALHPALELCEIFPVQAHYYKTAYSHKLDPHEFSQEFLSHGVIHYEDSELCQARIEDLIEDGLYELFPQPEIPAGHRSPGLYTALVVSRMIGFPPLQKTRGEQFPAIYSYDRCSMTQSMTEDLLKTVRKLAMRFVNVPDSMDASTWTPPLHILLIFLTFEKREVADPVFVKWIEMHYEGEFL